MINQNQQSLFFVSLPKSGTVYSWYSLSGVTGLSIPEFPLMKGWDDYNAGCDFSCPEIYACGDYNTQLLLLDKMKRYLNGYIFGSHMQASYHNMRVLEECGIDKISVLLRDPRDALVSWVHHVRNLGYSARNYISKIYHIPRNYYDWSVAKQFDFQIRTFLPVVVNWVEGWLDYYSSEDKRINVQFVLYDELKRDPVNFIRRITGHQGFLNIDTTKVVVPEVGKMHFRKGEHGQWKEEFTSADQRLVNELIQDRIEQGFIAAAKQHPGFVAAETYLQSGNYKEAATAALLAIIQFSSNRKCYNTLFRAVENLGENTEWLRRQVDSELKSLSVEDMFIYRDKLVNECKDLVCKLEGMEKSGRINAISKNT